MLSIIGPYQLDVFQRIAIDQDWEPISTPSSQKPFHMWHASIPIGVDKVVHAEIKRLNTGIARVRDMAYAGAAEDVRRYHALYRKIALLLYAAHAAAQSPVAAPLPAPESPTAGTVAEIADPDGVLPLEDEAVDAILNTYEALVQALARDTLRGEASSRELIADWQGLRSAIKTALLGTRSAPIFSELPTPDLREQIQEFLDVTHPGAQLGDVRTPEEPDGTA